MCVCVCVCVCAPLSCRCVASLAGSLERCVGNRVFFFFLGWVGVSEMWRAGCEPPPFPRPQPPRFRPPLGQFLVPVVGLLYHSFRAFIFVPHAQLVFCPSANLSWVANALACYRAPEPWNPKSAFKSLKMPFWTPRKNGPKSQLKCQKSPFFGN